MEPGDFDPGEELEEVEGVLEPEISGEEVELEREKHERVESKIEEVQEQLRFLHEQLGPKD